jgi:hypothetical protein
MSAYNLPTLYQNISIPFPMALRANRAGNIHEPLSPIASSGLLSSLLCGVAAFPPPPPPKERARVTEGERVWAERNGSGWRRNKKENNKSSLARAPLIQTRACACTHVCMYYCRGCDVFDADVGKIKAILLSPDSSYNRLLWSKTSSFADRSSRSAPFIFCYALSSLFFPNLP